MLITSLELATQNFNISSTTSGTWYADRAPMAKVEFSGVGAFELTLTFSGGFTLVHGHVLYVLVKQNATGTCTIVWPSDIMFSGADDVIGQGASVVTKYEMVRGPDLNYYATKTVY